MEKRQYICPKCGCQEYECDQFQATGETFQRYLMYRIRNSLLSAAKDVGIRNYIKRSLQWGGIS